MVKLVDPIIGDEEKRAVMEVLNSGMIAQGPKTQKLEEEFAKFCGTKYAIAVNSGTSALHTALYALGIKPGDEVITTPFTFVATANSIIMQGATPIFADIDSKTFNLDPKDVEKKITEKTKAIIPVDLFGQIYDYSYIKEIAQKHGLYILEDAAQAVGAELEGQKAGSFGDIGAFSLYATKNLISGEGGIITTNNEELMERAKMFRHHGQSEKTRYEYYDLGYNYRMTDIQAAIALEQLKKIDSLNEKRIQNAFFLNQGLSNIKCLKVPYVNQGNKHVYHQYTVKITPEANLTRDQVKEELTKRGIGCAVYYPKPLHLHPFFKKMGYKEGDFPVAEEMSKRVLSLPVQPKLTKEEIERVITTIKEILI